MIFRCCDERRRNEIRRLTEIWRNAPTPKPARPPNGIDYLEVADAPVAGGGQRQLRVAFVEDVDASLSITPANVRISGGERVANITVGAAGLVGQILEITVDQAGDFSIYTLELVGPSGAPLAGLDPQLATADFSFKVDCSAEFDCDAPAPCPEPLFAEPDIDYLARDNNSLRRLLLDRMSLLAPTWSERSPADEGVALIELLAYVGDQLSYQQDAVATEAYLATARRRTSVRRHARLLDYPLDDGANARAWVHISLREPELSGEPRDLVVPAGSRLLTGQPASASVLEAAFDVERALASGAEVFETMAPISLRPELDELRFYTYGDRRCCLPAGATAATLDADLVGDPDNPRLRRGDLLAFEEVVGPATGAAGDADPAHRHVVRLVKVESETDLLNGRRLTTVAWGLADALPFALCVSGFTDAEHGSRYLENVSVARGNIVLADHGWTASEELPIVPPASGPAALAPIGGDCIERALVSVPARYQPRLQRAPLTQVAPPDAAADPLCADAVALSQLPATAAFAARPAEVLPAIYLRDDLGLLWCAQRDLLASDAIAREFVSETEIDGTTTLRFGDDINGQRPAAGLRLTATYRTGNGLAGNVGAGAIAHIMLAGADRITEVRNPLPAQGGRDPESIERVKAQAPYAFRTPDRAVTPADYAAMAKRFPDVQGAQAAARWTGSWPTIFLAVDRNGGRPVDADFEASLRLFLERFRLAGHDLEINGPTYVPLELALRVCLAEGYFRSDVGGALRQVLGSRRLADGQLGAFHPDRYSFGQPVYVSSVLAAAQRVPGVISVEVVALQRLGQTSRDAVDTGVLTFGALEVAQLADDSNFPERGQLRLELVGGR